MGCDLPYLTWLTQAEYNAQSLNGPNLVRTLRGLTLDHITTPATYEGYTVWGIVLHLVYWSTSYHIAQIRDMGLRDLLIARAKT